MQQVEGVVVDEPQIVVFKGSFKLAAEPRGVARSAALAAAEMVLVSRLCFFTSSVDQLQFHFQCQFQFQFQAGQTCPQQQSYFVTAVALIGMLFSILKR